MKNQLAIIHDLVLVKLRISSWHGRVDSEQGKRELREAHNATSGTVQVKVCQLPKATVSRLQTAEAGIRRYWYDHTLPWENGAWRVIPTSKYVGLIAQVSRMKTDSWEPVVREMVADYDGLYAYAQTALKGLFDPTLFPTREDFARRYDISVRQTAITNPDDIRLHGLSEVEVGAIRESIRIETHEKLDAAIRDVVRRLRDVVADVVERLARDPEKERVKYKGLWKTLRRTVDVLPGLNISKDSRIDELIENVRERIALLDPEFIRESRAHRETVRNAAQLILADLDTFRG